MGSDVGEGADNVKMRRKDEIEEEVEKEERKKRRKKERAKKLMWGGRCSVLPKLAPMVCHPTVIKQSRRRSRMVHTGREIINTECQPTVSNDLSIRRHDLVLTYQIDKSTNLLTSDDTDTSQLIKSSHFHCTWSCDKLTLCIGYQKSQDKCLIKMSCCYVNWHWCILYIATYYL